MKRECQQENYLEQIEELREKMVATALVYGISHPKVLWYSQQIDEKHNLILGKLQLTSNS
jgi:hypothetical protein